MVDLIDRQAAIDAVSDCGICIQKLLDLPAAQPERKVGEWINEAHWGRLVHKCNQCGNYLDFNAVNAGRGMANFCPNCGARMEG